MFEIDLPQNEKERQYVLRTGIEIITPIRIGKTRQDMMLLEHAKVNVSLGRNVIRRMVSKQRNQKAGTVKEYFSSDDYSITISGQLRDYKTEQYPVQMISRLNDICNHRREVQIECDLMDALGVSIIAIDKLELSEPVALWVGYSLHAWSDQEWDLFKK